MLFEGAFSLQVSFKKPSSFRQKIILFSENTFKIKIMLGRELFLVLRTLAVKIYNYLTFEADMIFILSFYITFLPLKCWNFRQTQKTQHNTPHGFSVFGSCLQLKRKNISWKYNIRRNVNSNVSIVTMRRVAIIFFELGLSFHAKIFIPGHFMIIFCLENCA